MLLPQGKLIARHKLSRLEAVPPNHALWSSRAYSTGVCTTELAAKVGQASLEDCSRMYPTIS